MKIFDLIESLNYTAPIDWSGTVGYFSVKDHNYTISVVPADDNAQKTYAAFFDPVPKVANIEFSLVQDKGIATQDSTGTVLNDAFKVFAVVAQGVAEQTKLHGYDILIAATKRLASPTGYESRVSAYKTIVDKAARKAGMAYTTLVDTPEETIFLVYRHSMQGGIKQLKNHVNS